jgi:hypothetical protein
MSTPYSGNDACRDFNALRVNGSVHPHTYLAAEIDRLEQYVIHLQEMVDTPPCPMNGSHFCRNYCRLYKEGCYDLY